MPEMNGFDVLRSLRKRQVAAPAILITTRSDKALVERALAAGFARIVEKPLLEDGLIDTIRELTAQVGLRRDRSGDLIT